MSEDTHAASPGDQAVAANGEAGAAATTGGGAPADDSGDAPAADATETPADEVATDTDAAAAAAADTEETPAAEPEREIPTGATQIQGLIFDLDGTLIDSREDIANSINAVRESLEMPVKPIEEVAQHIGQGVRNLLEKTLETDDEEVLGKALTLFLDHYAEHCLDHTEATPGAKEILEHFKNKPCAVVSNKPEYYCRAILSGLGLDSTLMAIIGGDTTEARKPDPRPIQEALDLMGVEAESTVVIGDGVTDIEGGRAAGTRTCAVTYGLTDAETLAAQTPDFTVDDLPAIARLFA